MSSYVATTLIILGFRKGGNQCLLDKTTKDCKQEEFFKMILLTPVSSEHIRKQRFRK